MNEINYVIENEVFRMFPGYTRGVIVATRVKNSESSSELVAMLRSEEASLPDRINKEEIAEYPRILSWRDAFRAFGAKPAKYRPSIEAMIRRVLNGNELPTINTLVDIGSVVSLRHIVPVGGHAIDFVKENIELRRATGEEDFYAFGSDKLEHPKPGEIIFTEGRTVLTRRWSWRQAEHTSTVPSTTAIEFNIDGMPPVPVSEVDAICKETMGMIERFCGGELRYEILSEENPEIRLI